MKDTAAPHAHDEKRSSTLRARIALRKRKTAIARIAAKRSGAKTKGQIPQPKPYTRSHEGEERKAAVPGRDDKPIYGLKTSKNYVTANAVENILQAPKRVPQTEERYTAKEDFGKVL